MCTVLQKKLSKYDFNTMLSGAKLKKEYISLPITEENKVDWLYMEHYVNDIYNDLIAWV